MGPHNSFTPKEQATTGEGRIVPFAPSRSRQLTPYLVWRLLKIAQFLKYGRRGHARDGETRL